MSASSMAGSSVVGNINMGVGAGLGLESHSQAMHAQHNQDRNTGGAPPSHASGSVMGGSMASAQTGNSFAVS